LITFKLSIAQTLVATIKEDKSYGFWNEGLAHISRKLNRQTRDAINKAARLVSY
jgi:putative transposase